MKQQDTLQEDLIQVYGLDVFGLPMDQMNLLPAGEDDLETVEQLAELEEEELAPLLPFLLIWMRDMTWPVSLALKPLLLRSPEMIVSGIQTVLSDEEDDPWHTHLIEHFIMEMPRAQQLEFRDHLVDLIDHSDKKRNPLRAAMLKAAKAALQQMDAE